MKKIAHIFMIVCATCIIFTGCRENKSAADKIEDAVEEVADEVEDAVEEVVDEVEDAGDAIEDAVDD